MMSAPRKKNGILIATSLTMPVRVESRPENAAKGDWRRSRQTAAGRLAVWIFLACIFAALPTLTARAEENVGAFPSITTISLNLGLLHSFSLHRKEQAMRLNFDSRFSKGLKDLAEEKGVNDSVSKSLLRKRLIWPGEGPRAKLRPGFGEFFHGETVEPLRSSGAGVEDSRYLYVKFSFRF